ncbi:MAG: hypothetical protein NT025_05655 [bacterium]|nr:hypothetical protein [bacterium]
MNSSRLFRALITGLTLLACLWFLNLVSGHHGRASQMEPVCQDVTVAITSSAPPLPDSCPPVEILSLPLAAMDNTCMDGVPTDLSCYTGMLSGGAAREYALRLKARCALRVAVEPRSEYFDVSFVLFAGGTRCVLARDENGAGQNESAVIPNLEAGVYRLIVGGYGEDCGPYLLSVRDQTPPVAQVSAAEAFRGRNGTVIHWRSFAEVDLAHFALYRMDELGRRRIAVLRAHGSPAAFADYRFTDRDLEGRATYSLEAVSLDGRIEVVPVNS